MFLNKVSSRNISKLNVLLYTLDLYNKSTLINMIQKTGIRNVVHSNNIDKIESTIKELDIDLIFLEVDIFDGKVKDFITFLSNHKLYRNTPKILITSDTDYSIHTFAVELGFDSFLIKPFNLPSIKEVLTQLFDKYSTHNSWYILNSIRKLIMDNDLDMANKYISRLEKNMNDFYLKYLKSLYFFHKKEYKKAIKELNLLTLFKPNMVEAYKLLADCYLKTKNREKYLESLEKTISLSPKNPEHNLKVGEEYIKRDNVVKAEKHLKYVESVDPKADSLNFNLAKLYVKKGDFKKAERYFNRADKFSDNYSIQDLNDIALDYKKQKQYKQSIGYFKRALEIAKEKKYGIDKVLFNIATVYFEMEDYKKANYYVNEALNIKPSFKEAQKLRSRIIIESSLKNSE